MKREGGVVKREGGVVKREGGIVKREGGVVKREGGVVKREGEVVKREGGAEITVWLAHDKTYSQCCWVYGEGGMGWGIEERKDGQREKEEGRVGREGRRIGRGRGKGMERKRGYLENQVRLQTREEIKVLGQGKWPGRGSNQV